MSPIRTLLAALLALCIAAFPAPMSRMPVAGVVATAAMDHHADHDVAGATTADADTGGCHDPGLGKAGGGSAHCVFACCGAPPAFVNPDPQRLARTIERVPSSDPQVGSGLPARQERPPRPA